MGKATHMHHPQWVSDSTRFDVMLMIMIIMAMPVKGGNLLSVLRPATRPSLRSASRPMQPGDPIFLEITSINMLSIRTNIGAWLDDRPVLR